MIERRKHPRYEISHQVTYIDSQESNTCEINSHTFNVSRGGVGLKIEDPMQTGRSVSLKINNKRYKDPVHALGKVVWIAIDKDAKLTSGIKFKRIGWTESDKLFLPNIKESK